MARKIFTVCFLAAHITFHSVISESRKQTEDLLLFGCRSCLALCDPMDGSMLGLPVLQDLRLLITNSTPWRMEIEELEESRDIITYLERMTTEVQRDRKKSAELVIMILKPGKRFGAHRTLSCPRAFASAVGSGTASLTPF